MSTTEPAVARRVNRLLAAFVLAVALGHHVGVLFEFLGEVGEARTRVADWIDLATPYAVVGLAGAVLVLVGPPGRALTFALGAIVYTQGHGIHLAANSIGNVDPGDTVHLWDEVVGHDVWYGGLAILVAGLALGAGRLPPPATRWWIVPALVYAFTIFTNLSRAARPRSGSEARARLRRLGPAGGARLDAGPVAWTGARRARGRAVYWRGFPQFSELGWI